MTGFSTTAMLAYRALNRPIDEHWVEWAAAMLEQGLNTHHLCIFAGELPPFNQFELKELADKVFEELGLDWADTKQVIRRYAAELLQEMLAGKRAPQDVLGTLKDVCIELDHADFLFDFYLLYFAQEEIQELGVQWYWPGANRENMSKIVTDYAHKWVEQFGG